MSAKKIKTNASRILDELGVAYTLLTYAVDEDDLSASTPPKRSGWIRRACSRHSSRAATARELVVACSPSPPSWI